MGNGEIKKRIVNYALKWGLKPLFLSLSFALSVCCNKVKWMVLVMQKYINPLKSAGNCGSTTFFDLWLDVLKTTGIEIDNQILTTSCVFSGDYSKENLATGISQFVVHWGLAIIVFYL